MSDTSDKSKTKTKLKDLEFIRIFDPNHIPVYLIEQIKGRDYTVDDFYKFQKINCIRQTKNGPMVNPLNLLYVIVDKAKVTKGYSWMVIDPLAKDLVIQTFSMDKDYWFKGDVIELLAEKVREIKKSCDLNSVYWITKHPKHSQKHGFKPSKNVLMEFKENEDGIISETSGDSKSADTPATTVHEPDNNGAGSASAADAGEVPTAV